MHQKTHASALRTTDIAYIGLFVAAMAICSWISIPLVVPVTLQTFAVFLAWGFWVESGVPSPSAPTFFSAPSASRSLPALAEAPELCSDRAAAISSASSLPR